MIWPPVKAWTSMFGIDGHVHFVAINYGGKLKERWVLMMSVIDASVLVKVSWLQLADSSIWKCGWDEDNYSQSSELVQNECETIDNSFTCLSADSGLTIPITEGIIRPWYPNI